jgi:hypothetical protein
MEMEVLSHILVGLGIQDMFPEPYNGHWSARAMICFKISKLSLPNSVILHLIRCDFTAMFGNGQFEEIDKYIV